MRTAVQQAGKAMAPALFLALLLVLWETGYRLAWWNGAMLPGPSQVGRALFAGVQSGSLVVACRISLLRLGGAFAIAMVLGTGLGLLNGIFPLAQRTVGVTALGLQTLPSICWLPLAAVWFGLGEMAILFVTMMGALLAITLAVGDGIRGIPPHYLRAARMMGARGWRLYWEVVLPAAFPAVIGGAKQGWAFAWRSLMAGELLAVSAGALGLGQTLKRGRDVNDMALVLAVMAILVAIGMVADGLVFHRLERAVRRRWGLAEA